MNIELSDGDLRQKTSWKLGLVLILVAIGLLAVVIKLFFVQIIDSEKYSELAKTQHESKIKLKAERGNIYDRNGILLASNIKSISLAVDPKLLNSQILREHLCRELENRLGIPYEKTLNKINSATGSFVWIARCLLPDEAKKLDSIDIKGFIRVQEPRRNYLYGSTASHLIGCTDIDNKGLAGIELYMDSLLKGKPGYMVMARDAIGRIRPFGNLPKFNPLNGSSVTLTIDVNLQRIMEYELMQGAMSTSAETGMAAAIDPKTGEILAMASYPSFEPNNYSEYNQSLIKNTMVNSLYEPGSTFKTIIAAISLEEGLTEPDKKYNGRNGLLEFKDFKIKDSHPLGIVTMVDALVNSSNVIFSDISVQIPDYILYKYLKDFGFGTFLGIDMPGEEKGIVKKPEEYNEITKRFIGFGYGIVVTPLQILNAYSSIANGGVKMKPYVVKSVTDNNKNLIYENKPIKQNKIISPKTAEKLTGMLIKVVTNGTGKPARITGMEIAGKTGTTEHLIDGQYTGQKYTASFIGFFPAENPKAAMIVILNNPKGDYYGGTTAAPIFRKIVQGWMSVKPELIE